MIWKYLKTIKIWTPIIYKIDTYIYRVSDMYRTIFLSKLPSIVWPKQSSKIRTPRA